MSLEDQDARTAIRGDLDTTLVVEASAGAGKTTELIRRIRRYKHGNKRCLLIKYKNDTRYSEEMAATHDRCAGLVHPVVS